MPLSKKHWDVANVTSQIHLIARECSDSSNDGFTTWGCKQDLYLIQEVLNKALRDSPNFGSLEDEWLKNQEQQRIIKLLKD